jgi:hypothetical protein
VVTVSTPQPRTPFEQPFEPPSFAAALRRAGHWLVEASITLGMALGGAGMSEQDSVRATAAPTRPRPQDVRRREQWVEREVTRGLAELEHFLDQQRT